MPEIVGGLQIASWEFTRAWGIEPASASGKGIIAGGASSAGIAVGEYYAFAFGSIVFYGIVSSADQAAERETGYEYPFSMVDNRVRLHWGMVFGQWNMAEDPDIIHANPFPLPAGDAIDNLLGGTVGFDQGTDFTGGLDGGGVGFDNGVDFGDGAFPDESNFASGLDSSSISRGRLYGHIIPQQWGSQLKTYTTEPRSAASILAEAFARAVGGAPFALNFHSSQSKPVFNVDANSGMTLAALVSQLAEAQGLQVTLDGQRTLRFSRRGGTLVIPENAHVARDGLTISSDPTRVRVVGDRVLVQMNSIDLEPDWKSSWEAFIVEPAWLAEVKRIIENDPFSPVLTDDNAGHAELAARAREITVSQYIAAAGIGSEAELEGATTNFADHGRWGKISRMDLPAWTYINAVVFRSYRIPDATLLMGLPMRAMEIHESLLCAVEITGEGDATAIQYRQAPIEFYPPGTAYVMAKGQPLDLLDSMDRQAIVRLRIKDMRAQWAELHDFTIDAANHSIRFAVPVFLDGDPAENKSILLFPNQGEGGHPDLSADLDAKSDYLNVCVPNPDFEITSASIRCAMTFKLGRFYKDFGSGPRWSVASSAAITEHLLDASGGTLEHDLVASYDGTLRMPNPADDLLEILYEDGSTARDLAADQADGLVVRAGTEQSGTYTRHGEYGTNLTGAINRITITVNREDGLRETVEFAKPRPTRGFVSSKEIAQRVKSEELFDGQADLRREVNTLKAISKLERLSINDTPRSSSHDVISHLFTKPIGGANATGHTIADPNTTPQWPAGRLDVDGNPITGWRAGDFVWLDDAGLPSQSGLTFGGVVVCDSPKVDDEPVKYITVTTQGTVPVACAPGLSPGVALAATPGDWKCTAGGTYPIGMLAHHGNVPGTGAATLALVRLGGGGSPKNDYIPWKPVFSKNGAIYQVRFNLGSLNNIAAGNWDALHTLADDDSVHFVVLNVTTASGQITGLTIALEDTGPAADFIAKDIPPVAFKILLGAVDKVSGQMILHKNLTASAAEVFRESKEAPATGGEPFSRWWRWAIPMGGEYDYY